jgi:hypothetical protein
MPPDSLRAILDSVFADPAYRWVERPEPLAVVRRWFGGLLDWLGELRDHNPLGYRLVLGALVVVLVAILVHALWVLVRTIRPAIREPIPSGPDRSRRNREWYRTEAARLAGQGRYPEAMQADFLGLILAWDAAELVRFHPAKTPREYAREPGLAPDRRVALGELVGTLYGCVFARRPCGGETWSAWSTRVRELDAGPH